jgi:hypothetical protein
VEQKPQRRYILPILVLALVGATLVGSALLVLGANRMRRSREPIGSATATLPFPTVQTSTPTTRPTSTPPLAPTGTATPRPTPTSTPTFTPTPTPTPRVTISEIRSLGRLETAQFFLQTVIDLADEPSNLWEQILGTDKLLLVAGGEVVAGFDLAKMQQEDITVRGPHITVVLPPPEILYSRVDNEETFVYERQSGLFRKPDPRLEGQARQLAEQAMVERALRGEILRHAEANGQRYMEALLHSFGFTDIVVIVGDSG